MFEGGVRGCVSFLNRKKNVVSLNLRGVDSDAEEKLVLNLLEECGAFSAGLAKHRVMFCSTQNGAVAMIRQLQPHVHIEDDAFIAEQLNGKVRAVCSPQDGLQQCVDVMEGDGARGQ
ncbi:hypothetical protein, conserved [Eimeria acervulina]|uniref:Uncharacterized protein n=1 Tax=Eimeria acervulina TaxID=5801 RepID=U6GKS6_EIMAC|nr:hypothetical protein, conserved [Eimeria acervulina]CDI80775.1 hypothetical protein, conserved [Eimeria acervulina]